MILSTTPRLFIDDRLIARRQGLRRRVVPAAKLPAPVLVPEAPWEERRVYTYGTVLRDPDTAGLRMWYMTRGARGQRDPALTRTRSDLVLHATSPDGRHWRRSAVGRYTYDGARANNIVHDLHSPSVLHDPDEPDPGRRFKMLGAGSGGYWGAVSADGYDWRDVPGNPVLAAGDTITVARDPASGRYLAFHKVPTEVRGHRRRVVQLSTSLDFEDWTAPTLVLAPDETDDTWAVGPEQRTEFYNLSAFPWGDGFLGWVTVFHRTRRLESAVSQQSRDDGPIHVQLVHSPDGRTWHRCKDRSPAIDNGPDEFDAGCILGVTNTPVCVGDEVWFYYTAINTTHGGPPDIKRCTIARAAWQRDRFVGLRADAEQGVVETPPMRLEGDGLVVNADAAGGRLVAELLDEGGRVVPGFGADDCVPLTADRLAHRLAWTPAAAVPTDRPLRVRLFLRESRLFSLQAAADAPTA